MILIDANLLVYAQVTSLAQHEATCEWLESQLHGATAVGLPGNRCGASSASFQIHGFLSAPPPSPKPEIVSKVG